MEWMLLVLFLRIEDGKLHAIEDRQATLYATEQACYAAGEALQAGSKVEVDNDPSRWSVSTCVAKKEFERQNLADVRS